jgi:hypothetical protein
VEKVSPDLVVQDANHQTFTVRYDAVNAMLLNEFRKQHEVVKDQQEEIARQQSEIVVQRDQIASLRAGQGQVAALIARLDAQTARLDALEKAAGR